MSPIEETMQASADPPAGLDRRRFLAIVSASLAAASSGCSRLNERGEIVSYRVQPEGTVPGVSRAYASCLPSYPHAPSVLVVTREGRPIKIEGNPEHPASGGATDVYSQAATLDLYDPDRLGKPLHNGQESNWEKANSEIRAALRQAAGSRRRVLLVTPALVSPTARSVVEKFKAAYRNVSHLRLEMFHAGEVLHGRTKVLGGASLCRVNWDAARTVLGCECDFLGPAGRVTDHSGFAARRRPENGEMNRLWVVEGGMTSTGGKADHRLGLRPSAQPRLLLWLLTELAKKGQGPLAADPQLRSLIGQAALPVEQIGLPSETLRALLADLLTDRTRNCVLAGEQLPWYAHSLAAAINWGLGNEGTAMTSVVPSPAQLSVSGPQEWAEAAEQLRTGDFGVVLCLQANPVYGLSIDLGFAAALEKAALVVSSSLLPSETTGKSHWVLPAAHDLESWGDNDEHSGLLTLQQPTLVPLFESRQWEHMPLAWLPEDQSGVPDDYAAYLKSRWQTEVYPAAGVAAEFERYWQTALHDGFIPTKPPVPPAGKGIDPTGLAEALAEARRVAGGEHDLLIVPGSRTYDGRFANNGWLQELPNPVTTQVWGNAAVVSEKTAGRLGRQEGQLAEFSLDGRSVTFPVLIEPGVAEDVVVLESGYAREQAGSIGTGVGFNAKALTKNAGGISPWLYTGVTARAANGSSAIVRIQTHHTTQSRSMIQEIEATAWPHLEKREAAHEAMEANRTWEYKGHKWALAVDLSACTGCGACTIACVAENNIPVVGADQVRRGREMHWVRLDRYYVGDPGNPRLVHQPMMCQQCDYAPCEKVCPVAATVHSPEGLDEMIYNRCVGTRYCANNCPYKVRRFNFLDYHDRRSPAELAFNPEVTVRRRGIMEKCTFCVQRIAAARLKARIEGRPLKDGDIQTACQQACPAGAIVFGDSNDPHSRVHKLAMNPRGYLALGELGVQPAVTYLSVTRNPYPGLKI